MKISFKRRYIGFSVIVLGVSSVLCFSRCGKNSNSAVISNFVQVERLGRPAINEALITKNDLLNAFNMVAPSTDSTAAAGPILLEAANTLTALFAGVCYLNGTFGLSLTPAGVSCPAGAVDNTPALTAAGAAAAKTYVEAVAAAFIPDVLRIDTTQSSGYAAALCGSSPGMLCGGRLIDDNVMDIMYGYLLNGDLTASVSYLKNGATYNGANSNQGHQAVLSTFPYLPPPY